MVDERNLNQPFMFFCITKEMHGIRDRAINVVPITGEIFADQSFVSRKKFFDKRAF
jgi:hypothetical protein